MARLLRFIVVSALLLCWAGPTFGQTKDKDYETRLKAGKEIAYQKFLLQPNPATPAAPLPLATRASAGSPTVRTDMIPPHTFYASREAKVRSSRTAAAQPSLFQPMYDSRYHREWPRPVTRRVYTPAHYEHDGSRYRYVPSSVRYETFWAILSRDRYHFEGSHYRIESRFDW